MKKERVRTGEDYWHIGFPEMYVDSCADGLRSINNDDYNYGNYFHTKEEAESMAKKLRAVLNGADVIETPSEEEIETKAYMTAMSIVGEDDYWRDYYEGFVAGVDWLKSKIVK